jgi:chemotaxis protein MotB
LGKKRKKKEEGKSGGAPEWMVTYSDMVTLLLTFFVMLLAMASFESPGRVDKVIESLRRAFGVGGYSPSPEKVQKNPAANTSETKSTKDQVKPIVTELREILSKKISDDLVKMTKTRTEVRVMLDPRILFAPGSTELHPSSYGLVANLANAIKDKDVNLYVEGHTDSTGDSTRNWEISALRAVSVVEALEERGVPGKVMQARGMGQFSPADIVDGNSSWNRRVELIVQSDNSSGYEVVRQLGPSIGR